MAYEWRAKPRDYEQEKRSRALQLSDCEDHPLVQPTVGEVKAAPTKGTRAPVRQEKKSSKSVIDPLSGPLGGGDDPLSAALDPLSMAMANVHVEEQNVDPDELDTSTFEPWVAKKASILSKYTTSEKLSITTSFLSASDREKVVVKAQAQATVTDKVKHRLEQLDDFEEGSMKEMMNLSQQEYVKRIDELHQAMSDAWDQDHRVKTLKIAIQCSKLLGDTSVIKFYPSKFVLITDILDTFGTLVYDRIWRKATIVNPGSSKPTMLPKNFTPEQVPDSAKETCRNWFFKIASIRELVPRFYVETAILKCYNFLTTGEFDQALHRLTSMIRGMGNPLVAAYARCYIARVGALVAPHVRSHLLPNLFDFFDAYKQLGSTSINNVLAMQRVEFADYLQLYVPAIDWMLQCVANRASQSVLENVLEKSQQQCNSALVLHSVLAAFDPAFIASRAGKFVELSKECDDTGYPRHSLYRTLGMNIVLSDPPEEERLSLLNEVWKLVTKLKDPSDYIGCAEVWIEYPCKHFGKREVSTFLGDIIRHMTPDRAFEEHYPQLQSVMAKVMAHMHDFSVVFSMDKFLPFIDLFQRESIKVEVCRMVAETFARHQVDLTTDPVVLNGMMYVCKVLHDSINALSLRDEERQISNLLIGFLRKVSHGRDLEAHLNFLVEARSNFSNLQAVVVHLVQAVNSLAMQTHSTVKGNHTRKTAAFVRACAAYTFITIPGVIDLFLRLNLYLISAQVAVLNQALTQADTFLKTAISLLAELPATHEVDNVSKSTDVWLFSYVNAFLSTLLIVPDHPEREVVWLLKGLLNVLQDYNWDPQRLDTKGQIFLHVLTFLCAASQERYIYRIPKVDSNDQLYGADKKFIAELAKIVQTLTNELFEILKALASTPERQAQLSLHFVNILVAHVDLQQQDMAKLVLNLWNLTKKQGAGNAKLMSRTAAYVRSYGQSHNVAVYSELADRMV